MREAASREIDGLMFEVQQLGGRAAGRLFVRLSAHLAPALGQAAAALGKLDLKKGLASADVDLGDIGRSFGAAAERLLQHLTPDEYEAILKQLLETARVTADGKNLPLWPQFDEVMAGKVMTQLKLLAFALEVNYKDFWGALAANRAVTAGVAALTSKGSSTSSQSGPAGA